CTIWNTWGPISATALVVFPSWTEATIATFANWGPIMFVLSVFPTSYSVNRWGLRAVVMCYTGCTALTHVLRCVTIDETLFTVFANICGIVNGIEATILLAGAALPAIWFPAAQRVTATAFPQVMNVMGSGASFLQPLIVHAPGNDTSVEEMTHDIRTLMIIEMCIAVFLFLLVVVHFPSAPPSPPSPSSTVPRLGFVEGFRTIAKNLQFWQVLFAYSIFTGVSMVWLGVMTFSLQELGIDQDEAVWIGVYNSICTGIVCLLTSRVVDFVYGHLKAALLCLMVLSSLCYVWFMLLTLHVWPSTDAQVYITVLGGQSLNFACTPLFYELAVETTHPSPESGVGTLMTLFNNFVGALFLFLFYIPGISDNGNAWMTYLLVASNVSAIFPVLFFKEEYKRSRLDRASLTAA
ncbi:Major facilitator superfamily, partial [Trinorchestia longiramus]